MPSITRGEIPDLMNKVEALYICLAHAALNNVVSCEVIGLDYLQLRNRADLLEVIVAEIQSKSDGDISCGASDSQSDIPALYEHYVLSEVKDEDILSESHSIKEDPER